MTQFTAEQHRILTQLMAQTAGHHQPIATPAFEEQLSRIIQGNPHLQAAKEAAEKELKRVKTFRDKVIIDSHFAAITSDDAEVQYIINAVTPYKHHFDNIHIYTAAVLVETYRLVKVELLFSGQLPYAPNFVSKSVQCKAAEAFFKSKGIEPGYSGGEIRAAFIQACKAMRMGREMTYAERWGAIPTSLQDIANWIRVLGKKELTAEERDRAETVAARYLAILLDVRTMRNREDNEFLYAATAVSNALKQVK